MRAAARPAVRHQGSRAFRDRVHFDAISSRWAAKDFNPACRAARELRLRQTVAAVELPPGARVLEVGCGAGFAARYLHGRFSHYLGIDHSAALISIAREVNGRDPAVRFEAGDALDLQGDERFDLVLMVGVLHHVPEAERLVRRVAGRLAPGGWLAVNEPQPANPLLRAARRARKRLDADYSDEQCEIDGDSLAALLCDAGLERVRLLAQGLLSTPFAEVPLRPVGLATPVARLACAIDRLLERRFNPALRPLSWNLVASGRRPVGPAADLSHRTGTSSRDERAASSC
jgi:2-polyprenyl-3-methyl-5-hydroxy-6-metoxy-1,4-benzoquinol methylase